MVYLFDGLSKGAAAQIVETRDGSSNTQEQFIHGTQYIDEIIMMRAVDQGDMYVHQDANWNVIGTTDLGAAIVERNVYTPYGQLTVNQETAPGDYDGDQDVDATDRAAGEIGGSCRGSSPTGACRTLDLDFDNEVDDADLTLFDNLNQGISRHQGRTTTVAFVYRWLDGPDPKDIDTPDEKGGVS